MEAQNDDFSLEEWPSLYHDNLDESFTAWEPPNLENTDREELPSNYLLPDDVEAEDLPPYYHLNRLGIDVLTNEPLDYIISVDPSGFDPGFETEPTSPSSSADVWWTSTESVLADSSTSPEMSSLSPDLLHPPSPAYLSSLENSPIDVVQMSVKHRVNIPPTGGSVPQSLTRTPAVQSSPSEASTTHQPHQKPSRTRLSQRERRKRDKPVKCPICNKGHQYMADLNKHILARHRDVAASFNLSATRHVCDWCCKSFARRDHLLRHLTRKHGRPKEWRSRKQKTA
ncbi:hypothetical protein MFIFM68171_09489 [Madurella fahalii]|uniref:C2H2-type domain-containing protein n=1 Tax=Madurella fahalii TaxID=1157608 RepID=A0ABQ0GND9_9PEZI